MNSYRYTYNERLLPSWPATTGDLRMRTGRNVKNGFRVAGLFLLTALISIGSGWAQSTLPLVQKNQVTFVGAFAIGNGTYANGEFNYGGYGLSFWKDGSGRNTLFMEGNDQQFGKVGQIQIPADNLLKPASTPWSSLNQATILQGLYNVTPGFNSFDPGTGNPDWLLGTYVYGGRLLLAGSNSYSFNQTTSLGVWDNPSALNGASSNFHGFYPVAAVASARAVGGYFIGIPPEWQSSLGGPVMAGECCLSVISTTSFGPALTVINPANIGTINPIPGTTVLYYPGPGPNELCGAYPCEATQQLVFNLVTRVLGGGFVPGTRTVFFVTGVGTGPYCYDTAAACNDPVMSDVKGPHAQPYRYQIIAYDANDLVKVKNGTSQTYTPRPYNSSAPWVLPEISGTGNGEDPRGHGAAFDPNTGRLYVRIMDGNQPTIYVYQVATGVPQLSPPPNLRVN